MVRKESFEFSKEDRPSVILMTVDSQGRKQKQEFKIGGVECSTYDNELYYSLYTPDGKFVPEKNGPRKVEFLKENDMRNLHKVVNEYSEHSIHRVSNNVKIANALHLLDEGSVDEKTGVAINNPQPYMHFDESTRPSITVELVNDSHDQDFPLVKFDVDSVFTNDFHKMMVHGVVKEGASEGVKLNLEVASLSNNSMFGLLNGMKNEVVLRQKASAKVEDVRKARDMKKNEIKGGPRI